ncbi:MAG: AAA family ATPase [Phycisphaerae bacterium]|jgi:ATP-dependent Clp protease ATP-binding subunit ClpB
MAPSYIIETIKMIRSADSRSRTVTFQDQLMPSGSVPDTATVTVTVGRFVEMRVEPPVHYSGNPDVARWLEGSSINLPLGIAERWLATRLEPSYGQRGAGRHRIAGPMSVRPDQLTDLDQVNRLRSQTDNVLLLEGKTLFEFLNQRIRGQEHALTTMVEHVIRHVAKRDPRRPLTIMEAGPTGVGKTRAAVELVEAIRTQDPQDTGYGYLRLDMCQYRERHRVSELFGAPQGYVGYGEGALLIDQLAANPRSVILFDEIEKAHGDLWTVLMNAMDCGRLTSPARTENGTREVDCRHAIFLFTTNLQADGLIGELQRRSAFDNPAITDEVCRRTFAAQGIRPEMVGRIGCFLVFRPLSEQAKAEIVTLAVRSVAREYGLTVTQVEPEVVAGVLDKTLSRSFGMRPYEYVIEEMLGRAFAQAAAKGAQKSVKVSAGPPPVCTEADEELPQQVPTAPPHAPSSEGSS